MNNKTFITATDSRGRRVMLPLDRIILIREETDIHEKEKGINTIIQSENSGCISLREIRETFDYIVKEIETLNKRNERDNDSDAKFYDTLPLYGHDE